MSASRVPGLLLLLALSLAAPLPAQIISVSDFSAPLGTSYVIGLEGRGNQFVLSTVSEAFSAARFSGSTPVMSKLFTASDFIENIDTPSSTALDPLNNAFVVYTATVAFAPSIVKILVAAPNSITAANPSVSNGQLGKIAFDLAGSLYYLQGDGYGVQKFAHDSYVTSTLTFGTSGPGALSDLSYGLAVVNGVVYALDLTGNRIARYDSGTGTYLGDFAVTGASADSTIAVSATGRLYLSTGSGSGNIYDATTGTALNTFMAAATNSGTDGRDAMFIDDATGYLYTFDAATGLHIFYDAAAVSAIPEPSAYAALAGLAALGLVLRRRRAA